ncbi:MAG: SEC-C metal-binding domain-containing protein [Acidobacteriota bacterium]
MDKKQKQPKSGRNQTCPCGSGKKYKQCCALKEGRSWASEPWGKAVIAVMGVAVVIILGYFIAQTGGNGTGTARSSSRTLQSAPYYNDATLSEVDFSELNEDQKKTVLDHVNGVFCSCGCSLTLAQCVVTDSTCPLRNGNIAKIQSEVNKAAGG